MRTTELERKTKETYIKLKLNLDGKGKSEIDSGCGFFNHMLELFTSHGRFDLNLYCKGDVQVDFHHTVEDIGIALGQAFSVALGDKKGITRYGSCILPMDEALILCSLDISGRSYVNYKTELKATKLFDEDTESTKTLVGSFDTELVEEFLYAFARELKLTLHIKQLEGRNTHHIIEGVFKSLSRALRIAVSFDPGYVDEIPSTKGSL